MKHYRSYIMRRLLYLGITLVLALTFTGCGQGNVYVSEILSDQIADGDIAYDPVQDVYTITNGPNTIFFGIDEVDRNLPEYRAFLDFPLDGSTGEDTVPLDAEIIRATLEVYINEVSFAGTVPTLLDLVSFSVNGLAAADFNSAPIEYSNGSDATLSFDFFSSDVGYYVQIDVTTLMRRVQQLGLSDFQVRFLLDLNSDFGLVGIEDRPNISVTAPLLRVKYR